MMTLRCARVCNTSPGRLNHWTRLIQSIATSLGYRGYKLIALPMSVSASHTLEDRYVRVFTRFGSKRAKYL